MSEPTDWIEWAGGECPIKDRHQEVNVRFRNGSVHTDSGAHDWDWDHREPGTFGHRWDIVAYSLVQP